jgi:hypothetical protein
MIMAQSKTEARNQLISRVDYLKKTGGRVIGVSMKRNGNIDGEFFLRFVGPDGELEHDYFKYANKPTYRSPEDEEAYSEWS